MGPGFGRATLRTLGIGKQKLMSKLRHGLQSIQYDFRHLWTPCFNSCVESCGARISKARGTRRGKNQEKASLDLTKKKNKITLTSSCANSGNGDFKCAECGWVCILPILHNFATTKTKKNYKHTVQLPFNGWARIYYSSKRRGG